jgi:KDO2-lipid IV(A) lauroyltransferase
MKFLYSKILYPLLFLFFRLFARLPFFWIYLVSDFVFVTLYYIVGYRKEVVFENLRNSFPQKSEKEIKSIAKKYYSHLADTMVETIKIAGMTAEDFEKRVKVNNVALLNQLYDEGRSVVMFCAHYGNWEWVLFIPKMLKHTILPIYKPLSNPYTDAYFTKLRSKFGGIPTPMNETLRTLVNYKRQNKPTIIWLAADQVPALEGAYWTEFFHQDTPFFMGGEKIARKMLQVAVFMSIRKIGRGYYEMDLELMERQPEDLPEGGLILQYINKLEKLIREEPAYWLWSHKRWKHKRMITKK